MREREKAEQVIKSACGQLLDYGRCGYRELLPDEVVGKKEWRQTKNLGIRFEGKSFYHTDQSADGEVITVEVSVMDRGSIHMFVYPGRQRPMHPRDDFRSGYVVERGGAGGWRFVDVREGDQGKESEDGWGVVASELEDLMVGIRGVVGN